MRSYDSRARVCARLYVRNQPWARAGGNGTDGDEPGPDPVGGGPSRRLSRVAGSGDGPVCNLRRPSRRTQPCHAGPGLDRWPRHPRAARRLYAQRQQQADADPCHCTRNRSDGSRRRWAGCHNIADSACRVASAGHRADGTDPARSVVNEWGRAHDMRNLFIVDGSIFVTSGGANPTSTLQALALYIADQMKQRLANLFD